MVAITKPVRLRIVSIERDSGKSKIPFLAMDQQEKFLTGTIDDLLVTDDMIPDTLIECTPSELDYDEHHIILSKDVSYIKTLENDPSFPKPDEYNIMNIRVRDPELEEFYPYILQATILHTPEITEITRTDGKTIPVTYTIIGDGHGQINLYQFYNSSLTQFSVGDKIKVIGAVAFYGTEGEVELSMSPYASIVKLSPSEYRWSEYKVETEPIDIHERSISVHKKQVKGGIEFTLNRVKFFKDYTEADISIGNMNSDAELQLLENDTSAFQDTKQFRVSEVVRGDSMSRIGIPYIKPKIPSSDDQDDPMWTTGLVRFRPLDQSKKETMLRFKINKKIIHDNYDFTFKVLT
jgi:hypothetical protein